MASLPEGGKESSQVPSGVECLEDVDGTQGGSVAVGQDVEVGVGADDGDVPCDEGAQPTPDPREGASQARMEAAGDVVVVEGEGVEPEAGGSAVPKKKKKKKRTQSTADTPGSDDKEVKKKARRRRKSPAVQDGVQEDGVQDSSGAVHALGTSASGRVEAETHSASGVLGEGGDDGSLVPCTEASEGVGSQTGGGDVVVNMQEDKRPQPTPDPKEASEGDGKSASARDEYGSDDACTPAPMEAAADTHSDGGVVLGEDSGDCATPHIGEEASSHGGGGSQVEAGEEGEGGEGAYSEDEAGAHSDASPHIEGDAGVHAEGDEGAHSEGEGSHEADVGAYSEDEGAHSDVSPHSKCDEGAHNEGEGAHEGDECAYSEDEAGVHSDVSPHNEGDTGAHSEGDEGAYSEDAGAHNEDEAGTHSDASPHSKSDEGAHSEGEGAHEGDTGAHSEGDEGAYREDAGAHNEGEPGAHSEGERCGTLGMDGAVASAQVEAHHSTVEDTARPGADQPDASCDALRVSNTSEELVDDRSQQHAHDIESTGFDVSAETVASPASAPAGETYAVSPASSRNINFTSAAPSYSDSDSDNSDAAAMASAKAVLDSLAAATHQDTPDTPNLPDPPCAEPRPSPSPSPPLHTSSPDILAANAASHTEGHNHDTPHSEATLQEPPQEPSTTAEVTSSPQSTSECLGLQVDGDSTQEEASGGEVSTHTVDPTQSPAGGGGGGVASVQETLLPEFNPHAQEVLVEDPVVQDDELLGESGAAVQDRCVHDTPGTLSQPLATGSTAYLLDALEDSHEVPALCSALDATSPSTAGPILLCDLYSAAGSGGGGGVNRADSTSVPSTDGTDLDSAEMNAYLQTIRSGAATPAPVVMPTKRKAMGMRYCFSLENTFVSTKKKKRARARSVHAARHRTAALHSARSMHLGDACPVEAARCAGQLGDPPVPFVSASEGRMSVTSFVAYHTAELAKQAADPKPLKRHRSLTPQATEPSGLLGKGWLPPGAAAADVAEMSVEERTLRGVCLADIGHVGSVEKRVAELTRVWNLLAASSKDRTDFKRTVNLIRRDTELARDVSRRDCELRAAFNGELARLRVRRDKTLITLNAIEQRERWLASLHEFAEAYTAYRRFYRVSVVKRELGRHLAHLRSTSLAVVEALAEHQPRGLICTSTYTPFIWHGQNYLLKMYSDLLFVHHGPLQPFLKVRIADNPLLLDTYEVSHLPQVNRRLEQSRMFLSYMAAPLPGANTSVTKKFMNEYYDNCTAQEYATQRTAEETAAATAQAEARLSPRTRAVSWKLDQLSEIEAVRRAAEHDEASRPRQIRIFYLFMTVVSLKRASAVLRQRVRERKGACTLQKFYRKNVAARLLRRLRRERTAAVTVQKWIRGLLARRKFVVNYARFLSARMIQCVWRRRSARLQLERLRRQHVACVTMQRYCKKQLVRCKMRNILHRNKAMRRIQRNARRFIAIRETAWRRKTLRNVLILQRAYRCHLARHMLIRLRSERIAAVFIQKHFRGCIGKQRAKRREQELEGASVIMKMWRVHLSRQEVTLRRRERLAATIAQLAWRVYTSKSRTATLRAQRTDALTRHVVASREIELERAAIVVQAIWKDRKHRETLLNMMNRNKQELTTFSAGEAHDRAVVIQCCIRQFLARRRVCTARSRYYSALKIQRKTRDRLKGALQRKTAQARIIQAAWHAYCRRVLAVAERLRLARLREEADERQALSCAAVVVQSLWRGLCARRCAVPILQARREARLRIDWTAHAYSAATMMQAAFRMHLARRLLIRLRHIRNYASAAKIQAIYRGTVDRRFVREAVAQKQVRESIAASLIQTMWRCSRDSQSSGDAW